MAIHLHDKRIRLRTTLSILGLAAILFVSAGLHAQQSKQTSPPKHCLWLVETPLNQAVFLLGSLHVLKSDTYPLAKAINEAYSLSQKEIGYLEPVDFQLDLLGKMKDQEQNAFLGQTLKDLDVAAQMADDMLKSWEKGDVDNLYAILFKSFEGYPQIENRLLGRRNIDWVKKIEAMMAEDKTIFIIVGAAHLIGPGSVVALLRDKGYKVKQK